MIPYRDDPLRLADAANIAIDGRYRERLLLMQAAVSSPETSVTSMSDEESSNLLVLFFATWWMLRTPGGLVLAAMPHLPRRRWWMEQTGRMWSSMPVTLTSHVFWKKPDRVKVARRAGWGVRLVQGAQELATHRDRGDILGIELGAQYLPRGLQLPQRPDVHLIQTWRSSESALL